MDIVTLAYHIPKVERGHLTTPVVPNIGFTSGGSASLKRPFAIPSLFLITSALLIGCSSTENVKNKVITKDMSDKLFDSIGESRDLTVNEVRMLMGRQLRFGMANTFGASSEAAFPVGKTIGSVLEQEKLDEQALEAKKAAEAKEVKAAQDKADVQIKEMDHYLGAKPVSKSFIAADIQSGEINDQLLFKVRFQNRSDKAIKAFKCKFVFGSLLDEPIKTMKYSCDDLDQPFPPDSHFEQTLSLGFNQFEQGDLKLKATPFQNLKIAFVPLAILFTDGTKIEAEDQ